MMRIIPRSPGAYLFRDAGHATVGWLEARTVRFTCFASHRDAVAAAVQGALALAAYAGGTTSRVLHAGPGAARPPNDAGGEARAGVRVLNDGRHEWVYVHATRVARLVPPTSADAVPSIEEVLACGGPSACPPTPEANAFSIEFLLSEDTSLDVCLTIVQVLYAAVHHHRMRPAARASRVPSWR
ncbi:hypothetical protein J421_5019 (plasmid) [Gemmatirosa kalamazoonensis]|uniref:Uncharacterized protein n=1 Tax=Gemmatirosa kalamazoonensis TaxID=861299 RepID=W0RNF6_9BACT|nr:hypothetical protein [Gemmatirosa kalamazoonensis]AHG92554.1 hypothetical protein J421_5019 [Gemmatirosa kalamazoonensis]